MSERLRRFADVLVGYSGEVRAGDLVVVQGAVTNLDALWDMPEYREHCEQLGAPFKK